MPVVRGQDGDQFRNKQRECTKPAGRDMTHQKVVRPVGQLLNTLGGQIRLPGELIPGPERKRKVRSEVGVTAKNEIVAEHGHVPLGDCTEREQGSEESVGKHPR